MNDKNEKDIERIIIFLFNVMKKAKLKKCFQRSIEINVNTKVKEILINNSKLKWRRKRSASGNFAIFLVKRPFCANSFILVKNFLKVRF